METALSFGCPPREQRLRSGALARHGHCHAYVALVLNGRYVERGLSGRWTVEAGQLVAHTAYDRHDNIVLGGDATVLNIAVPSILRLPEVFTVRDPDTLIAAVLAREPDSGGLLHPDRIFEPSRDDWPDELAARLRREAVVLSDWARDFGLSSATVSCGFTSSFGVSPVRFRLEAQTRRALDDIAATAGPLSSLTFDHGFADQAHLSRSVQALTGMTPSQWRRSSSIQDASEPRH